MSTVREQRLTQLGITQWSLRHPSALRGETVVTLPKETRLLFVSTQEVILQQPFMQDILQVLGISPMQVYTVAPQDRVLLTSTQGIIRWYLGVEDESREPFDGVALYSPALSELRIDGLAKRLFWQQLCQYETDIELNGKRSRSSVSA